MALRVSMPLNNDDSSKAFNTVRTLLIDETAEHGHTKTRLAGVKQQLVDVLNRLANDEAGHELRKMRCPFHGYHCEEKRQCWNTNKTKLDVTVGTLENAKRVKDEDQRERDQTKREKDEALRQLAAANAKLDAMKHDLDSVDNNCPFGSDHAQFYKS